MKRIIIAILAASTLGLTACKTQKKSETTSEKVEKKFDEKSFDPYFKGIGTEPFWNIELNDDFIVYKNMEGVVEVFPITTASTKNGSSQIIKSANKNNEISVVLSPGNCSDGMSDNNFDYKVDVIIKGKDLNVHQNGCGQYIVSKNLLGKWELNYFKGEDILENKYLKTPFLEFESNDAHFSGNTSCNGIKGTLSFDNENMKFSNIAATRMMCVHENMETNFLKELSNITKYSILNNELQLFVNNELSMKFRKVDE